MGQAGQEEASGGADRFTGRDAGVSGREPNANRGQLGEVAENRLHAADQLPAKGGTTEEPGQAT